MHLPTLASRSLALAALGVLGVLGCDPTREPVDDAQEARGGLLFDLTEEELVQIHATYLAEEDLELTRARLTVPFDCSLYDDFCDEVGAEAAEAITGETIDLARVGAPIEEIQALLDARIEEAVGELDPEALEAEIAFRGSSSLVYHTQGDFRLGVRNGITTPSVGDRRAWTQATTWQYVDQFPYLWYLADATQICVDAGTNSQTYHFNGQELQLESINPANACVAGDNALEISTWHDRLSSSGNAWYDITVHGRATASLNGLNFSKTAPTYVETY
ncbi:hypothetical protein [Nannocystis radixulma]|uniref:Lipoprotein n=1 Tax=Nannocystis radixulma TaxID=2995305 RepID=A0ABT5BME5_9BACT|nr:hypothetical protein [Nannocystis radixulma]MDC0675328.1 hypothetical protein [Nannocystis radixulma]